MKSKILLISLAFLFLMSCNKDERQAINSVEGVWDLTEITSVYGSFQNTTFVSNSEIRERGNLGVFNFSEETVDYNFTRNDTTYTGNANWNLVTERVNSGFTRTNKHTLTIRENFIFDVTFEDATRNSEKNATEMTFVKTATLDDAVFIEMKLRKH